MGKAWHNFRLIHSLNLRFDLRLRGYIPYGMRFFKSHFPYGFFFKDNMSTIEGLQEENSRTLGNYSRRLQDYSRISWSTIQPRDASSILEDFWLVVLEDA
jgi:hypothetical protein